MRNCTSSHPASCVRNSSDDDAIPFLLATRFNIFLLIVKRQLRLTRTLALLLLPSPSLRILPLPSLLTKRINRDFATTPVPHSLPTSHNTTRHDKTRITPRPALVIASCCMAAPCTAVPFTPRSPKTARTESQPWRRRKSNPSTTPFRPHTMKPLPAAVANTRNGAKLDLP
jgi:hypothetical protein